jgi:molybdopterin-guanine dinucleotide biosynthesis protein A
VPSLSNERTEPAGAIVLAGGSSTRLGFDKRSLSFGGVPLLEHLCAALRPHFDQLLVGVDEPERWAYLDAEIVVDARPGVGPLMGLAGCLARARNDLNFVTACDIPRPPMILVGHLLRAAATRDGAIPVNADGYIEPLFGAYRRRLLPTIERLLDRGERQVRKLYDGHDFAFVELAPLGFGALPNINTPEDLEQLKALLGQTG